MNDAFTKRKHTVIPSICKSWRIVLMGPYSWQDLDIKEWSRKRWPHCGEWMIHWFGPVSKLCVSGLRSTGSFSLIAQNFASAGSLQMLQLGSSSLTVSTTEHLGPTLQMLSILNLSYCHKIRAPRAIRKIGKNWQLLVKFCQNMNPLYYEGRNFIHDKGQSHSRHKAEAQAPQELEL